MAVWQSPSFRPLVYLVVVFVAACTIGLLVLASVKEVVEFNTKTAGVRSVLIICGVRARINETATPASQLLERSGGFGGEVDRSWIRVSESLGVGDWRRRILGKAPPTYMAHNGMTSSDELVRGCAALGIADSVARAGILECLAAVERGDIPVAETDEEEGWVRLESIGLSKDLWRASKSSK